MEFQSIEEKKIIKIIKEKNLLRTQEANSMASEINSMKEEIHVFNESNKNVEISLNQLMNTLISIQAKNDEPNIPLPSKWEGIKEEVKKQNDTQESLDLKQKSIVKPELIITNEEDDEKRKNKLEQKIDPRILENLIEEKSNLENKNQKGLLSTLSKSKQNLDGKEERSTSKKPGFISKLFSKSKV